MTPSCSSISYFPSAQTRNSRNGPTATFPEDSIPAHAGKTPGMDTTSHCVSAHPRSRGENALQPEGPTLRSGSSPLTRGKLGLAVVAVGALGLIPAHAGKTRRRSPRALGRAAHPRSRGENFEETSLLASCPGPSPLTRGKPQLLADGLVQARLIPAHAGKTTCRRASSVATSAHPRSRGENPILAHDGGRLDGSSPLTRGKRDLPLSESLAEGLIPAHAGKTSLPALREDPQAAHPRSRRENAQRPGAYACACGSSLLTRGKLSHSGTSLHQVRLIPAHAGKTSGRPSPTGAAAAHPRSRGENANSGRPAVSFAGSSPLTRGKRADDALRLSNPGLIPAHAGKTLRSGSLIGRTTAHPRSRGENTDLQRICDALGGSSPLTRGKPLDAPPDRPVAGLIPAHAGKTTTRPSPMRSPKAHPRSRGENAEPQP